MVNKNISKNLPLEGRFLKFLKRDLVCLVRPKSKPFGTLPNSCFGFRSVSVAEPNLVGMEGLEPSRDCSHTHLKRARIPIPPHAHIRLILAHDVLLDTSFVSRRNDKLGQIDFVSQHLSCFCLLYRHKRFGLGRLLEIQK